MPLKPIKTKSRIDQIKQQPKWAFRYALTNLKQRWPEAEPMIMKNSVAKLIYTQHVLDRYKKF